MTGVFLSLIAALGIAVSGVPLEAAWGFSSSKSLVRRGDFYSEVCQDEFAYFVLYGLLGKQDQGYYLEIGAGDPIYENNTYFFEKNLRWNGISVDISKTTTDGWQTIRRNPLLLEDATQCDYSALLSSFPKVIDYLSLDIDGKYDAVLEKLFCSDHVFKTITIEHDAYRYGDIYRQRERAFLLGLGYHLLCPDIKTKGQIFEDWWIYPSAFPADTFLKLTSLNLQGKEPPEIIQTIKTAIYNN